MPEFMPLGAMFEPIGFHKDGSPIWLFQGSAPDDDGTGGDGGSGNDSGDSGDGGDGQGEGGSGDGGSGSEGDNDDDDDDDDEVDTSLPDNVKAILKKNRAEAKAAKAEAKAAKAGEAAANAKVKGYEDKDKTELQKAQDDAAAEKKRAETLAAQLKASALGTAFLRDTTHSWVDPEDALELAMRKFGLVDLEIDEEGRVDKKAIKAIAKKLGEEKAYLVANEKPKGGASGGSFNNGGNTPDKTTNESALVRKYPSMRGRTKVT